MTDKKLLEQALEALEDRSSLLKWQTARDAIRARLEQPEHDHMEDNLAMVAAPVQEPVGCEGAIVNGRVYADRLEHDYKFECEAGPLYLCNDWVEFRRCFEWLAVHATPPAAQPAVQWQPIETAPKDVTLLLYGAKRLEVCVGMHHSRDGWVTDTTSEWASMYQPTHWMPLPAAPEQKGGAA